MNNFRVAFIHPFQMRLRRGIEVYLWELASALARQGMEVEILTWAGSLSVPEYARVPGITLRQVPAVRYFQAWFAVVHYIFWLLRGDYPHVFVFFAGYGEGLALWLVRSIRSIPFSVVFHFPPSLVPHRYREFKRWKFEHEAVNLIAVSQSTASEVQAWADRPCAIIGHGVDTERFKPNAEIRKMVRKALGFDEGDLVLISVAALEERKGMQRVILAMPDVLESFATVNYLILGEGPYREDLAALAVRLGLEERVQLLGAISDVQPYLCAADIMMVLSQGEASSISLLEALACELASITSAKPPFDELVSDATGLQVNEENQTQVAAAIISLAKDPARREQMGTAGREKVISRNSWVQIAQQYRGLIFQ